MRWSNLTQYLPSRRGILGINGRNLDLIYTWNRREHFINVDDKLACKSLLSSNGVPTPRTYHVVTGPKSLSRWQESLAGANDFVIKPNRGYGGNGIMLVRKTPDGFASGGQRLDADDIRFHILQICNGAFSLDNVSDTAYFEETLVNDPGLAPFMSEDGEGIADIRLIYLNDRLVMGMLRAPTIESGGRANLHQGGIGVGIDLETGLSLNGCHHNDIITHHPETGRPLKGWTIPGFGVMTEYGEKISDIVGLGYIGIDFAIDIRKGPCVLEVNARPGLNIQIANQIGLRNRLK